MYLRFLIQYHLSGSQSEDSNQTDFLGDTQFAESTTAHLLPLSNDNVPSILPRSVDSLTISEQYRFYTFVNPLRPRPISADIVVEPPRRELLLACAGTICGTYTVSQLETLRKEERIQHTLDMLDALRSSPLSTALYLGGREDSKVLAGAVLWDVFLSAWPLELPGFGREPSKIAELSPDKPNLRESLPALLPGVNLGDKQFGKKVGKHASEWGMDLSKRGEKPSSNAVAYLQRRVQSVVQGYDELRQGPYNPNAGGGNDYLFYRRANTLVLTNQQAILFRFGK